MTDHYTWFDPFQMREEVAYLDDRLHYETRDLTRELDMTRGALKYAEAHNRHLVEVMGKAMAYLPIPPLTVRVPQ